MNKLCKRLTDICLASLALIMAAPLFLLISILIWVDEPGSVFFAQARLGLHGKHFRLFKFRKFSAKCGDAGPGVTVAGDARMTAIGSLLERTKLDELPQLWNILKGDMSFVGPRPESLRFADLFAGKYLRLLDVLPGLFGPCQIAFRNESSLYPEEENPEVFYRRVLFPQKAEIDLAYFANPTYLGDVSWMLRGLWVTFAGTANWRELFLQYAKPVSTDIVIVLVSWILANELRFSSIPHGVDYQSFIIGLWFLPPIVIAALTIGGCYRSLKTGYFYLPDAIRLIYATLAAVGFAFLLLILQSRNASFYLLPMEWFLLISGLTLYRIWSRVKLERMLSSTQVKKAGVVVFGANPSGVALANWLMRVSGKEVVAFFDNELNMHGKQLMGLPVLNRVNDLSTFQADYQAGEIWVARQQLNDEQKNHITNLCRSQKLKLVVLSEMEFFSGEDGAGIFTDKNTNERRLLTSGRRKSDRSAQVYEPSIGINASSIN